ncbi:hypothetical protein MMC15_005510 [Xylographa vitiligo]|nr:hypothetical protein [Xylographa vitiligo]
MTIYRVFFHRLHSFPGPGLAKVSKFWNVAKTIDSSNYRLLDSLHRQYGDFVRTGPNEIAIFKAEAVRAMDAPGTRCIKAPWYDILQPRVSVATTRDKGLHDKRRKLWESALTTSALQEYEGRLLHFSNQLHEYINKNLWRSIDISTVSYYYSFDVMSDLAFGESLNMLQNNKYHFALDLLQNGMDILGPLSPVEWLVRIGYSIPRVAQHFKDLIAWSGKRLEKRMQDDVQRRDIVSGLIDASRAADSLEEDRHWLAGDTFAIIIAGSDTVASTLISIFYHLVQDPSQIVKLRNELDSCSSISNIKELKSMDHLNGVINEALRLHPGLPSGGFRQTPPEGLTISGQYIPGDVTIVAPRYTIGRLESCYKRAGDFVPERWYSEPGMVVDKSGFAPFSIGRYNCVGKNIALTQLRSVVALLVSSFDVAFAQDEDGVAVWRDLKDQFNSHPGKLRLVFSPRTKTETPSP